MKKPRVLLADDHSIVVEGLQRLLGGEFDLIAVARDGREMIELALARKPDLIVADVSMPLVNASTRCAGCAARAADRRWCS
jgi:CheY-like chemotaxis protein